MLSSIKAYLTRQFPRYERGLLYGATLGPWGYYAIHEMLADAAWQREHPGARMDIHFTWERGWLKKHRTAFHQTPVPEPIVVVQQPLLSCSPDESILARDDAFMREHCFGKQ